MNMPSWLRRLIRRKIAKAPLEIRRWLPVVTLEPLNLVLSNYEARKKVTTIVQVGACDGATNDPVRHYLAKGMARGILIEPNPLAFERLQRNYANFDNVTLIQAAIGEEDGVAHLYRFKKTDKALSEVDLTLQIASFYREHLENHSRKGEEIERITVPCRSLSSLIAELGVNQIDLLQIDAEGFDATVVRMALKMQVRPSCINFEHRHLKPDDRKPLFDSLAEGGYLLGYDEWNLLALQKDVLEGNEGRVRPFPGWEAMVIGVEGRATAAAGS
jgi:FkbM family methyltransferase